MAFLLTLIIILVDQLSKYRAIKYLKNQSAYIIIRNFFELSYVENIGAAFGILKDKRIFFIIITLTVILFLTVYTIRNYRLLNKWSIFAFTLLIGGASGNLIDRIRYGYVVDFISFRFFNKYDFPVFNFADICIVVSTFIIVILVLFDKFDYRVIK